MHQAQHLRQRLQQPGILVAPGVYDCISARIAEQAGFELVLTSGFGIAAATLGKPDFGYLDGTEMLYSVSRIVQTLSIPLIADIDTGYGNPLNVFHTVEAIAQAGVAGILLEDQEWPKRCGHFEGKRVIPMADHVQKLKAAIAARGDSGLVIIARTDALAPLGLDEAIARAQAYAEAGADIIFVEAPQSLAQLEAIAQSLPGIPLLANRIEGGKTPSLDPHLLEQMGYKNIVYALSGLFAASKAIQDCFTFLRQHQTTDGFTPQLSFPEFETIVDTPTHRQRAQDFGT
jgi:methylisocitrate lyase